MAATYATQRMQTLNLGAPRRQVTDAIPGNSSPVRISPRISTRSMTGVLCGASPKDSPSSSPAKSEFGDLEFTRKAIVVGSDPWKQTSLRGGPGKPAPAHRRSRQLRVQADSLQVSVWIIDPQHSRWMRYHDLLMVVALAFTAIVTPVEVAFIEENHLSSGLWWLNRLVDLVFLLDMLISFNLAYREHSDRGGHCTPADPSLAPSLSLSLAPPPPPPSPSPSPLRSDKGCCAPLGAAGVFNRRLIVLNYVRGWFLIDLISIAPFFLISFDYADPWGVLQVAPEEVGTSESGASPERAATLVRIVKLLRMLKLTRVFKASRVIERQLLDLAVNWYEMTYAQLKIIKLVLMLIFWSHLQACMWGLVSSWTQAPNWLSVFDENFSSGEGSGRLPTPLEHYAAAMYWSMMTLTSIGYGEMLPQNTVERAICSVFMLLSGVFWTYSIGTVASIATTLNPNQIFYETTMDQ